MNDRFESGSITFGVITWTAVALLSMLAINTHARELITSVRARVIADAVALTAVLSPEHATIVARANHVMLRELEVIDEERGRVCVVIQSGSEVSRACAELTTSTLDD